MSRFYFIKDEEGQVRLSDKENSRAYILNTGEAFENRKAILTNQGFLLDGYATWFSGQNRGMVRNKDFSVTLVLVPMSYESFVSGLVSNIDKGEKQGYYIGLRKFGVVEVGFFAQQDFVRFESLNEHVKSHQINVITVVFNETAGWCDLYINGVISNRKQFARNVFVNDSKKNCYIGKYVDYEKSYENTKTGVFHGIITSLEMDACAPSFAEVIARHKEIPYGKTVNFNDPDRSSFKGDRQRPIYHLIAPERWMNEPHAPFFYRGFYHIFYQANPHAPLWDNIQWGHLVSEDMVHWKDMPPALETEKDGFDAEGCWSGSAVVDKEGIPRLYYTAGNNNRFPNQGIAKAKPKALDDKHLKEWEKDESFLIEQKTGMGWLGEFRDPYVWLENDRYFMLVGTGDENNGGGNAVLYSSGDGDSWECHGFFLDYDYEINQEAGHVFELPVLLPLKDEGGNPDGHIFIFCSCQVEGEVVENYYFLGKWDDYTKTFTKSHEKARLFDLGNGTFTGPSGLVTPDGRSVVFTIAQGKRDYDEEFCSGWAHNGGLPIAISMQNGRLQIRPIHEIYSLKSTKLLEEKELSFERANHKLSNISENNFYFKAETDARRMDLFISDEEKEINIFYDADRKMFGIKNSDTGELLSKYRDDVDAVDIGDENIQMEMFVDGSMIEVYLNCLKSITFRFYTKGNKKKLAIAGDAKKQIKYMAVCGMTDAYMSRQQKEIFE